MKFNQSFVYMFVESMDGVNALKKVKCNSLLVFFTILCTSHVLFTFISSFDLHRVHVWIVSFFPSLLFQLPFVVEAIMSREINVRLCSFMGSLFAVVLFLFRYF